MNPRHTWCSRRSSCKKISLHDNSLIRPSTAMPALPLVPPHKCSRQQTAGRQVVEARAFVSARHTPISTTEGRVTRGGVPRGRVTPPVRTIQATCYRPMLPAAARYCLAIRGPRNCAGVSQFPEQEALVEDDTLEFH